MNETQLIPRQRQLLNLLAQYGRLKRGELGQLLSVSYPVSKLTLIRDLHLLISLSLIETTGRSRAVHYQPVFVHPLLRFFDLPTYFARDQDERVPIKTSFDFDLFSRLTGLFTKTEQLEIRQRSFTATTTKLDSTIVKRELERFVIELAWKSSKIEGNTYSLLETEALIKDGRLTEGKSRQEAVMILNHKRAFETLLENRNSFKALNTSIITQLHNLLTADLGITPGIRRHAVVITGTNYRPPDNCWQIEEGLQQTIKTINVANYPLEKALLAVALISYLQPFADGNKRTGRMLANALLLANDLLPLSYRSVGEEDYKQALILFYEQGSLYHLKRIVVDQYRFAETTYFQGF